MTITVVLDPPKNTDSPAVFATKASIFAQALVTLAAQINAETAETIPGIVNTVAGAAMQALIDIPAAVALVDTAVAATYVGQAGVQAGISTAQAVLAAAARDTVNTSGKSFTAEEGTAAGIAATTSGLNFSVLSSDSTSWAIWRNNAGNALYIGPGSYTKAYIDLLAPRMPVSPLGIIPTVQDASGRILSGFYLDGTPYPAEVDIPTRARVTTAEAAIVALQSGNIAMPVSPLGIIPIVQDSIGRIISGIYLDGTPFPVAGGTTYDTILPADTRLLISDYRTIVEKSPQKLSFIRSIVEGNNHRYCSPGSRVGFNTNSLTVKFTVFYNFLDTRLDARNYIGAVLADGMQVATFTNPGTNLTPATLEVVVTFGSISTRKIEIIWPYGDGMDLVNIKVVTGSSVSIASARPTNKLLLLGDSITHGFWASNILNTWAYKLCTLKSVQMVSEGYGSLTTVASYGTSAATGSGAYAVTVLLGYNDFGAQTALATFQAAMQALLTNIRAALPSAKIYAITPIYSTSTNTIPLSSYRTYIANAVTALADGNIVLVDGLRLMTNSSDRLSDGIHPNDTGASEIAASLSAIIT